MMSKQRLYSIALVSIAMSLMLVSTAGAMKFNDVLLKTDPCTGFVDILKFPACGCGFDEDHNCDDHSCNDKDKSCNKDTKEKDPKRPIFINYNANNNANTNDCDKCCKEVNKDKDTKDKDPYLKGVLKVLQVGGKPVYDYTVTNVGKGDLKGELIYGSQKIQEVLAPGDTVHLNATEYVHRV